MQLDDRDIVCETDYSPLSSAELAAQIEWHAAAMSGATAYDLERITGPARALLARAEAAEARVADLEAALVGMDGHMARLISERNDALDRAEAAEALAYERLEAALFAEQRASDAEIERDSANVEAALEQSNAREAWIRVAELETQLAEQQWRPVTEKPEKPGWYSVYDSDGHVFYNADIFPYRVARWTGKWDSAFNGLIDYWCPLPPAPQEPTP